MVKLLLTGGAGYLGSAFLQYHQGAYDITVFDNLLHGGDALIPYFSDVNFHFVKGDVRDKRAFEDAIKGKDVIVHLAAIVGLPACEADRHLAEEVNYSSSSTLAMATAYSHQRVIYSSTVSVYGKVEDGVCTEETRACPLSHYGQTKLRAENVLQWNQSSTLLRFPTLFGVSPRMRTDLMINDLTYQAVKNGGAVVFEPEVRRTFLHVKDAVRAIEMAIDNYIPGTYIPGDESLNVTKRQLADFIVKETGAKFHYAPIGHDGDARDYEVSFEKIKKLGYRTSVSLEQGIREVAQAARAMNVRNPYTNV
jgi:nucleoside-diphosphate-sugar epimerase